MCWFWVQKNEERTRDLKKKKKVGRGLKLKQGTFERAGREIVSQSNPSFVGIQRGNCLIYRTAGLISSRREAGDKKSCMAESCQQSAAKINGEEWKLPDTQ